MNKLALTTALSGIMVLGYGRSAYAGSCSSALGIYNCTGPADAATDSTVSINTGTAVTVITSSGFGIDNTSLLGGPAMSVNGLGGVTFEGSASGLDVTGQAYGLSFSNAGSGNLTIGTTGGQVTGIDATGIVGLSQLGAGNLNITTADVTGHEHGLNIINIGVGDTTIDTTAGSVTGTTENGIAINLGSDTTGLTLTTAEVTGGEHGISLDALGSGDIVIDTTQGDVVGTDKTGIYVSVSTAATNDVTITTGNVAGGSTGVLANAGNSGDLIVDTSAGAVAAGANPSPSYGAGVRAIGITDGTVSVTTADVTGYFVGVSAANVGTGTIEIDTSAGAVTTTANRGNGYGGYYGPYFNGVGVIAGTLYGLAYGSSGVSGISVTTGDVTSGLGVVVVASGGTGDTVIDTTAGTVTGDSLFGIAAVSLGGDLSVTTADVSGERAGVYVGLNGTSLTTIDTTAGSITSNQGVGIVVNAADGDVNVTTADVTGVTAGVDLEQSQSGDLTLDTSAGAVTATGSGADGIRASNSSTSGHMTITTANVTAMGIAIEGHHRGDGDLTIDTSAGAVIGGPGDFDRGIDAHNINGEGIAITTADVTGGSQGISVIQSGTGTTSVDSSAGTVSSTAPSGTGISVRSDSYAGDVNVTTADVVSDGTAVNISQYGNADVNIDTNAGALTTTSELRSGISVRNNYTSGDITVATADVSGGYSGINVRNLSATGATSIDSSAGVVTGSGGDSRGISADNQGGDLTITTGNVTATQTGIDARTSSAGSEVLAIDTTAGSVSASGTYSTGIAVYSASGDAGDVTVRTADVTGASYGIAVNHNNAGALVLDSTAGAVTGTDRTGIQLNTSSQTVTVTTADVASDRAGIVAFASGQGLALIDTSAGTVTAGSSEGVFIRNSATSTDIAITTADVAAQSDAIAVTNFGTGTTSINSSAGALTSTDGIGVHVYTGQNAGNISIVTADITADRNGIFAYSPSSTASISIDSTAGSILTATSPDSIGIFADASGGDLEIATAGIEASLIGILARGSNKGGVDIDTSAGSIVTTAERGTGISATGFNSDMSIVTGGVTGGQAGIDASQRGNGALTIDTTAGAVTATASNGLMVRNYGSNLSVTTADLSGANSGAYIRSFGTGFVAVDTTAGTTSSTGPYGRGLAVVGGEDTIGMTVRTADASAISIAVLVTNSGTGPTVVDTTAGSITSTGDDGISATNSSTDETDLTITAADVSAVGTAISGSNRGSGMVTIDTTAGLIQSTQSYGIRLNNEGDDVDVSTGDVSSYSTAVSIRNGASGTVNVDTTAGTISAAQLVTGSGVYVSSSGDEIAVSTSDVHAAGSAVVVKSFYAGDIAIDTTAGSISTTGTTTSGVYANASDSDVSVTTANVTAIGNGVTVFGAYTGTATVDTTAGTVTTTGGRGLNIQSDGADITIATSDVSGAGLGIFASQSGPGTVAIDTTAGTIESDNTGIYASSSADGSDITIVAADVTTTGAAIVSRSYGTSDVIITSTGTLETTGSSAVISVSQIGLGAVEIVNDGTITGMSGLSTSQAVSVFSAADGEGTNLTNNGTITGTINFGDGDDTFTNNGTWDASGSASNFGDGFDTLLNTSDLTFVAGNGTGNQTTYLNGLELFENSGRITMIDGFASDQLIIAGDFDGTGGSLGLDVYIDGSATTSDVVSIYGDITGDTTMVDLNLLDGGDPIAAGSSVVLSYGSQAKDGDFVLVNGPIQDDIYTYDLGYSSTGNMVLGSLYLESVAAYDAYPTALLNLGDMDSYGERLQGRQAFVMDADKPVIWVRADQLRYSDTSNGEGTGSSVSQLSNSFSVGADIALGRHFGGDIFGGVALQYVASDTSYQSISGADSFGSVGMGLGATLTWVADDGHFLDFRAQNLWTETVLPTQSDPNAGQVFSTSLEFGRNIVFADGWTAMPSLQFSRTSISFDDVAGAFGETMSLSDGIRTTQTIGTTVTREWALAGGAQATAFGSAHFSNFQSTGEIKVTADNETLFDREVGGTSIEFGFGGSVSWDDGSKRLYGSVSEMNTNGAGTTGTTTKATLGFEYTW
jgi:hypothetical protein